MKTTIGTTLLLLLSSGCAIAHPVSAQTDPAPTPSPDGSAGPLVEEVLVEVEEVWWSAGDTLEVALRLENPLAEALPLEPGRFLLEDMAGGRTVALRRDRIDGCERHGPIPPASHLRCVVAFHLEGAPRAIGYVLGEQLAMAPVPMCATGIEGLCPENELCVGGRCEPRCRPARWDGVCPLDHQVCMRGACVDPCSPENPSGGCAEGRCVSGACVLDCPSIAWTDDVCWTCAWRVIDAGRCSVSEDCQGCFDCPGSPPGRPTTCDCAATCPACASEIEPAWACLLEACPSCAE